MGDAAFPALVSQATVSAINHRGDIVEDDRGRGGMAAHPAQNAFSMAF